jgi:Flp pilus assembly protein TadG
MRDRTRAFFVPFLREQNASVAPLLALLALPLLGSVGAAVDFSRASSARAAMQGALDATALMLARQSPNPNTGQGQSYFEALFSRTDAQGVTVSASAQPGMNGTAITMAATATIPTHFMKIMGLPSLNLSVQSAVAAESDGLGCVLSLNPTISGAVTSQGSASTNLAGCALYDNSNHATAALTNGGSATIAALFVGVVGGISSTDGITATQGIKSGIGKVDDPYETASYPTSSGCRETNYTAKSVETIDPGVYCGGISVNANAVLTLRSGIYYLDGGNLSVNGGATLKGEGVTLVFTKKTGKDYATASINGSAIVNLTAMTSGPTRGIVVFGDRNIPQGTSFKFNGGATQYLGGAVYVPTGAISFSGGAGTGTSCTQIIGDTVTFVGNSTVKIDCTHLETKPFSAKLIRLTS